MTFEENEILEGLKKGSEPHINFKIKYSNEFYQEYINFFQCNNKKKLIYKFIKRLFDIIVSLFAIVLLFVPCLFIAIIIKCDSSGPVIFKNRRVGKNGKVFNCLKFRTMSTNAPPEVATSIGGVDSYITKVGKFLRKTSLDELPQFLNVLIGQMSIIGYRPLVPSEEKCNLMRENLFVFRMRPGISGYSQVNGRDEVYYKNKALMDAYYVNNASLVMDVSLIFKSVMVVLKKEGNNDENKNEKKVCKELNED